LAFLLAAAFAQAPPPAAQVSGRVVKLTGEVLRHATVTLLGPQRYTTTADNNGLFAFGAVAPGAYSLIAQRIGYASQKYGAAAPLARHCGIDSPNRSINPINHGDDAIATFRSCIESAPGVMLSLAVGQEMKDLLIPIAQLGVISGSVSNVDSEPVQGSLTAMKSVYERGVRRLVLATSVLVGPDGSYTVDDLPAGRYYLRATIRPANSYPGQEKPLPENDVPTFYPSAADASNATPVEVKPGEETEGINILVRRARVFTVRGAVADSLGGQVTLHPKDPVLGLGFGARSSSLTPDGAFEFLDIEPGAYVLSSAQAQAAGPLLPPLDVVVTTADIDGLTLSFAQGVAVTGAATVEGVKPAAWPTLSLAPPDQPLAAPYLERGSGPARFDPNGAFTFRANVLPGRYEVRIASPAGTYVKSIRYGAQDALHAPINIGAGASASLSVVLSAKVAVIAGKVANAKGDLAAGALVTAWPRNPEVSGGVHSGSTDQNGNFAIADLGPGAYYVAAWEDIDPGLADYPGFLARFLSDAAQATLQEGGRAGVNLKAIPAERAAAEEAKLP
jgi:hypothetical protein